MISDVMGTQFTNIMAQCSRQASRAFLRLMVPLSAREREPQLSITTSLVTQVWIFLRREASRVILRRNDDEKHCLLNDTKKNKYFDPFCKSGHGLR